MKSIKTKQSTELGQEKSNARLGIMWQLEPRIMFDGAAAATVIESIDQDSSWINESREIKNVSLDEADFSSHAENNQIYNDNELEKWLTNYQLPSTDRNEIAFIDTNVEGYQAILSGIKPGIQIVLLDSNQDGVEQIASILSDRSNIDAIHIISHGEAGVLRLGTSTLNAENLNSHYVEEFATIRYPIRCLLSN